ncbi:hypothetical protein P9112_008829 [Eukaryota sp. TZLM1-RC]
MSKLLCCGSKLSPSSTNDNYYRILSSSTGDIRSFALFQELGSGSNGQVFHAMDKSTKEECAIKVIRPKVKRLPASGLFDPHLLREIAILRKMDHPNVLKLKQIIADESGTLYIITEYADGGCLLRDSSIGKVKPLPSHRLRNILLQIVSGLQYVHTQGIVHHDIKPSNILLIRDSTPRRCVIADFGVSTKRTSDDPVLRGSPLFIAPECFNNGSIININDPAVDVYALGVTLYILAFGQSPWPTAHTKTQLISTIVDYKEGKVDLNFPPIDSKLRDLLAGLLHPDPKLRLSLDDVWSHPWIVNVESPSVPNSPLSPPSPISLTVDMTESEIDAAVSVVNELNFESRKGSEIWSAKTLTDAQRALLVFHSAVNLVNLSTRLMELSDTPISPERDELTQKLVNWTEQAVVSDKQAFSCFDYAETLVQWKDVLSRDVLSAIEDRNGDSDILSQQLIFVKNDILPILEDPDSNLDLVGQWQCFQAKHLASNFKAVFSAIQANPDSSSGIKFICNGNILITPIQNTCAPFHTIYLDFGMSELDATSEEFSSCDESHCSEFSQVSNPVFMPQVVVDLARDLICNSRKYSPANTTIRASVANIVDPVNDQVFVRIVVHDMGVGITSPSLQVQFGQKIGDRRGFGRGFGLTKAFISVTQFLNGRFLIESSEGLGTKIDILIPVPEQFSSKASCKVDDSLHSNHTIDASALFDKMLDDSDIGFTSESYSSVTYSFD